MTDPQASPRPYIRLMILFTLLVCTTGGLVVKIFGDHNAIFFELMREFGKTGRFHYRHAPGILITAFFSLIAGASLGPEAPLADACGWVGTLISDKLKLDARETRTMGFGGISGCWPPSSPTRSAARC